MTRYLSIALLLLVGAVSASAQISYPPSPYITGPSSLSGSCTGGQWGFAQNAAGGFCYSGAWSTLGFFSSATAWQFSVPTAAVKGAFGSLAACSSSLEGSTAAVTDSTTATWGATITGSGTNHVLAYCDGTNWTVAAK